jgi:putative membrane protein insertion efficiency factor
VTSPVRATAASPVDATRDAAPRRGPVVAVLMSLISLYRRVSALSRPRCRFAPSCSAYALEALAVHGAARGSWLAVRRIARCHPFNPGGVDHVPAGSGKE